MSNERRFFLSLAMALGVGVAAAYFVVGAATFFSHSALAGSARVYDRGPR